MLKKLTIKYGDGRQDEKIVHVENGKQVKIYPKLFNIAFAHCKTFKYEVEQHDVLCPAIVNFNGKYKIMPWGIECHPKTELSDIRVIKKKKTKSKQKLQTQQKPTKQTWKFDSSSGGGTYTVTKIGNKLKCDCPGTWRAKDRRCKHIKEVEKL